MLGLGSADGQMRSNINKESEKMSEGSSATGIKPKTKYGSESPCHPRGGVGDEQRQKQLSSGERDEEAQRRAKVK